MRDTSRFQAVADRPSGAKEVESSAARPNMLQNMFKGKVAHGKGGVFFLAGPAHGGRSQVIRRGNPTGPARSDPDPVAVGPCWLRAVGRGWFPPDPRIQNTPPGGPGSRRAPISGPCRSTPSTNCKSHAPFGGPAGAGRDLRYGSSSGFAKAEHRSGPRVASGPRLETNGRRWLARCDNFRVCRGGKLW